LQAGKEFGLHFAKHWGAKIQQTIQHALKIAAFMEK